MDKLTREFDGGSFPHQHRSPEEQLTQQARVARTAHQQQRIRQHKLEQRQNQHAVSAGFDATVGMEAIKLADGSILYAASNSNGAIATGQALELHQGAGIAHVDAMPAPRRKKIEPEKKKPLEVYPFKCLLGYYDINSMLVFAIGADRAKLKQLPTLNGISNIALHVTGKKLNDWSSSSSSYNSDNTNSINFTSTGNAVWAGSTFPLSYSMAHWGSNFWCGAIQNPVINQYFIANNNKVFKAQSTYWLPYINEVQVGTEQGTTISVDGTLTYTPPSFPPSGALGELFTRYRTGNGPEIRSTEVDKNINYTAKSFNCTQLGLGEQSFQVKDVYYSRQSITKDYSGNGSIEYVYTERGWRRNGKSFSTGNEATTVIGYFITEKTTKGDYLVLPDFKRPYLIEYIQEYDSNAVNTKNQTRTESDYSASISVGSNFDFIETSKLLIPETLLCGKLCGFFAELNISRQRTIQSTVNGSGSGQTVDASTGTAREDIDQATSGITISTAGTPSYKTFFKSSDNNVVEVLSIPGISQTLDVNSLVLPPEDATSGSVTLPDGSYFTDSSHNLSEEKTIESEVRHDAYFSEAEQFGFDFWEAQSSNLATYSTTYTTSANPVWAILFNNREATIAVVKEASGQRYIVQYQGIISGLTTVEVPEFVLPANRTEPGGYNYTYSLSGGLPLSRTIRSITLSITKIRKVQFDSHVGDMISSYALDYAYFYTMGSSADVSISPQNCTLIESADPNILATVYLSKYPPSPYSPLDERNKDPANFLDKTTTNYAEAYDLVKTGSNTASLVRREKLVKGKAYALKQENSNYYSVLYYPPK